MKEGSNGKARSGREHERLGDDEKGGMRSNEGLAAATVCDSYQLERLATFDAKSELLRLLQMRSSSNECPFYVASS